MPPLPPRSLVAPLALVAAAAVAIVGSTPRAAAETATATATFTAAADAAVDSTSPDTNYGSSPKLRADGSPDARTYLRFDVTGLKGAVKKATLRLYSDSASSSGYVVHQVAVSGWHESAITYRNAPALSAAVGSSGPFAEAVWTSVDVTSVVQGNGPVSFALRNSHRTNLALASRETGETAPQLVVVTEAETAPPPPPAGEAATAPPPPPAAPATQPQFPIRAAFYYPWFPQTWTVGGQLTHYRPTLGYYSSDDAEVRKAHIGALRYAGMDAAISSWWGPRHYTDTRLKTLLADTVALGSPLKWAIYYELDSNRDPDAATLAAHLAYVRDNLAASPAYLRVGGRFVVFVYNKNDTSCSVADRWRQAVSDIGGAAYVVLKVFPGFRRCSAQPDGWHQYGPAVAVASIDGYSYSLSPGFWRADEPSARLARDLDAFKQGVRGMVDSNAPWQLVTTFNEWGEGTSVEPATEWPSASGRGSYLDALHETLAGATSRDALTEAAPVVAAAGDVACDPTASNFNGGLGSRGGCRQKWTSDLLLSVPNLAAVLLLGDIQYECGEASAYPSSYDPSWGRLKAITRPALGNHEYGRACGRNDPSPTLHYFGLANPKGYYSYDVGAWHIVVLNSECKYGSGSTYVGGCHAGSEQEKWLRSDLAAHPNVCTLAYWHEPRFSSGQHGGSQRMADLWNALVEGGVDVALAGHNHNYERFEPIGYTPAEPADANSTTTGMPSFQQPNLDRNGIRQFIAGTGGRNTYPFPVAPLRGEVVRNADTFGVLLLTLRPRGYDWKFVPEPGKVFADSGSASCH